MPQPKAEATTLNAKARTFEAKAVISIRPLQKLRYAVRLIA